MFSSRFKSLQTFDELDECTSDDEPAVIIEKVEQILGNGQKIVETENDEISLQQNKVHQSISSLCRVCSSKGFININSPIAMKLMVVTPTKSDWSSWRQPISRIITEVSGEQVSLFLFTFFRGHSSLNSFQGVEGRWSSPIHLPALSGLSSTCIFDETED